MSETITFYRIILSAAGLTPSSEGFGSVVKHSTADPGISSSIPLTPTKNTKIGDTYWFFPEKMLPCISALHWAR